MTGFILASLPYQAGMGWSKMADLNGSPILCDEALSISYCEPFNIREFRIRFTVGYLQFVSVVQNPESTHRNIIFGDMLLILSNVRRLKSSTIHPNVDFEGEHKVQLE